MPFFGKHIVKALRLSKSSKKGSSSSFGENKNAQQGPLDSGATEDGSVPEPPTSSISNGRDGIGVQKTPPSSVTGTAHSAITNVEVSKPKLEPLRPVTESRDDGPRFDSPQSLNFGMKRMRT